MTYYIRKKTFYKVTKYQLGRDIDFYGNVIPKQSSFDEAYHVLITLYGLQLFQEWFMT